jgi:septum site-determining protein MinC
MSPQPPFELEGMVSTITVLRLLTDDLAAVESALRDKVEQMPGFFLDAPVALDLSALEGTDEEPEGEDPKPRREVSFAKLVNMLNQLKFVPVGVRYLREARRQEARDAGLGILRGTGKRPGKAKAEAKAAEAQAAADDRRTGDERRKDAAVALQTPAVQPSALVLKLPLRSGQVVYAEQCDAISLSNVNAGAELIADGNIHVYGALRGRALAGAHGNEEARIFVRSLEADLIAIAGCYLRADEIPDHLRGKPAQVFLDQGNIKVTEL